MEVLAGEKINMSKAFVLIHFSDLEKKMHEVFLVLLFSYSLGVMHIKILSAVGYIIQSQTRQSGSSS